MAITYTIIQGPNFTDTYVTAPQGSCLANRPDHIGTPVGLDVRAGAHHHIANNNFYHVAPHRIKARKLDRLVRRCCQWCTHSRGLRLATPREKLRRIEPI